MEDKFLEIENFQYACELLIEGQMLVGIKGNLKHFVFVFLNESQTERYLESIKTRTNNPDYRDIQQAQNILRREINKFIFEQKYKITLSDQFNANIE